MLVLVAGEGPLGPTMSERANELGLDHASFRMLGQSRDVRPLLGAADVFLFTSRWDREGFGLSLVEGLASGTPVVSTDVVTDVVEVVGDAAYFYTAGDFGQLLAACRDVLHHPVEAAATGRRAQKLVEERLNTEHAVRHTVGVYLPVGTVIPS